MNLRCGHPVERDGEMTVCGGEAPYIIGGSSFCSVHAREKVAHSARDASRRAGRLERAAPLFAALRAARLEAGKPSLRAIKAMFAEEGESVSVTTLHTILSGTQIPSGRHLESLVRVLGADPDEFRRLWIKAQA